MKKETWIGGICVVTFALLSGIKNGITSAEQKEETLEQYMSGYYDSQTSNGRIEEIAAYVKPKAWRDFEIGNAFSISVPNTLELRQEADPYTKNLKELYNKGIRVNVNSDNVYFQQKGLSIRHPEALSTYCRIIMSIERGEKGDFPKSTEFEELDIETIRMFQEMAQTGADNAGHEIIGNIDVYWRNYAGTYALAVDYVRTGDIGKHICVKMYQLFNDDKMAQVTFSYKKEDADKWEKDLSNVIRTFKWK